MNVRHNPVLTAQPYENFPHMTSDRISADDALHQTSTVEQPKEVDQNKASPMLGRDADLNEQVVPVAELRLLAKSREGNSSTDKRARFRLFVAALLVVGVGVAVARYLYPEVESGRRALRRCCRSNPYPSRPLRRRQRLSSQRLTSCRTSPQNYHPHLRRRLITLLNC